MFDEILTHYARKLKKFYNFKGNMWTSYTLNKRQLFSAPVQALYSQSESATKDGGAAASWRMEAPSSGEDANAVPERGR